MEADIIVQGLQMSEEVHGLQYRTLVGDGDSSVCHQVVTRVSYDYLVQKNECANHVVRNYTSRLCKLRGENSEQQKLLTVQRLKRISNGARKAISHYAQLLSNLSGTYNDMAAFQQQFTTQLRADLINGPNHVFGFHEKCRYYFSDG